MIRRDGRVLLYALALGIAAALAWAPLVVLGWAVTR